MDIRVKKTKEKIKKAFISLLSEYRMDDITVACLCKQAKVNRSTFYVYYGNVMECFDEISDQILAEMKSQLLLNSNKNIKAYLEVYFETARKHRNIFKAIHSTNIHNPMISKMVEANNEILHSGFYIPKASENLEYSFAFSGFYGMVEVWLRNECVETNEELIDTLQNIIKKIL